MKFDDKPFIISGFVSRENLCCREKESENIQFTPRAHFIFSGSKEYVLSQMFLSSLGRFIAKFGLATASSVKSSLKKLLGDEIVYKYEKGNVIMTGFSLNGLEKFIYA